MELTLVLPCLTTSEQARLGCVERAVWPAARPHLKAALLQRRLRLLRQQAWMNEVLNSAKKFHAFVNRLHINLTELQGFRCSSLEGISFALRRRRDVRLQALRLCPQCRVRPVDAACYMAIGHKMVGSTPFLTFSCKDCMGAPASWHCDLYQAPVVTLRTARWQRPVWTPYQGDAGSDVDDV